MTLEEVRQSIELIYIYELCGHNLSLADSMVKNSAKQLESFERISILLSKYEFDFVCYRPNSPGWFYDIFLVLKSNNKSISISVDESWTTLEEFINPKYVFHFYDGVPEINKFHTTKDNSVWFPNGRINKEDILSYIPELVFIIDELE